MQHADIDPSLRSGEPLERLDDGFSPPVQPTEQAGAKPVPGPESALGEKSPF